jgi:hypothetical protein
LKRVGTAKCREADPICSDRFHQSGNAQNAHDPFHVSASSAVESRIARDFMEVPAWLNGGPEPSTVSETLFRADRLKTMRMRLSAAYKGVNALLMKEGAENFRSGQKFDHTVFFGENVDIHHIFPQDWSKTNGIKPDVFDSIINKTPLSYRTNRIIGGGTLKTLRP